MIYFLLALNSLLMIGLPIVIGIWFWRRYKVAWSLFFIGALGFIVSQIGHIPFNQFVLNPIIGNLQDQGDTIVINLVIGLLLGLSAGVFEEVTRYIFYRFMRKTRQWEKGLMFGNGWGGAEAIIFGILAGTAIINVYIYQSGLIDTLLPADALGDNGEVLAAGAQQIEELINSPPWMFLLGAVERFSALILHMSLAILVLQVFLRKSLVWLLAAIAWHTLVNAVAVFGSLEGWDVLIIEGLIGLAAVASFFIIRYFRPVGSQEGDGDPDGADTTDVDAPEPTDVASDPVSG